jgi:hypothetical protein
MWESEKFSSTLMAEGEIRLQTEGRTMLTGQNIQPEEEIRERDKEAINPIHRIPHRIRGKSMDSRGDQGAYQRNVKRRI